MARAFDRVHVYELYQAGANDIVREMFDSSLRAGRSAHENLGLSKFEAAEAEMDFYHRDRASVRELAALWQPGVPVANNPDYIARARELNRDLETTFVSRSARRDDDPEDSPAPDDRDGGYRSKVRAKSPGDDPGAV